MEKSLNKLFIYGSCLLIMSCSNKNQKEFGEIYVLKQDVFSLEALKQKLDASGYQTFNYISPSTQDTILMQQYFMVFLKSGPQRSQSKVEADSLQMLHLQHLENMFDLGYADISGPFGDNGDIRGITIYNVPNINIADSLAKLDPMVKSGRLVVEVHPWWAAKSICLR